MKHRRYSNKRLKQMLNEVLPDDSEGFAGSKLTEKKNENRNKQQPINLEDQQK